MLFLSRAQFSWQLIAFCNALVLFTYYLPFPVAACSKDLRSINDSNDISPCVDINWTRNSRQLFAQATIPANNLSIAQLLLEIILKIFNYLQITNNQSYTPCSSHSYQFLWELKWIWYKKEVSLLIVRTFCFGLLLYILR